jgi:hypothetical protein
LAGLGRFLHARRQSDRVPYRCVLHLQVLADRTDDHLAGVESHPNFEVEPVVTTELVPVVGKCILQAQRGVAGPPRVVLVRDRRPEQRHRTITSEPVHRALVLVHGLAHDREEPVQELAPQLRVGALRQLHRSLYVAEQHRHLLALTLQQPREPHLLGQRLRQLNARRCRRRWPLQHLPGIPRYRFGFGFPALCPRGKVERRVVLEHRVVEALQLQSGLDADLAD